MGTWQGWQGRVRHSRATQLPCRRLQRHRYLRRRQDPRQVLNAAAPVGSRTATSTKAKKVKTLCTTFGVLSLRFRFAAKVLAASGPAAPLMTVWCLLSFYGPVLVRPSGDTFVQLVLHASYR